MHFDDGSDILSKLGILESREESPRRSAILSPASSSKALNVNNERERFVDVKMDAKSDSDDDDIFDGNSLLASRSRTGNPRISHRKMEYYTCRFLLICLSCFLMGFVLHSCPNLISQDSLRRHLLIPHNVGFLFGILLGNIWLPRINSMLLLFLSVVLLTFISWMIFTFDSLANLEFISFTQGLSFGALSYGSVSVWLTYWRGHYRKFFFFLALISLGSAIALASKEDSTITLATQRLLHKREIEGFDAASINNADISIGTSSLLENMTTTAKPKKPQVAQGITYLDTKTNENEAMRKMAEMATAAAAASNINKTSGNDAEMTQDSNSSLGTGGSDAPQPQSVQSQGTSPTSSSSTSTTTSTTTTTTTVRSTTTSTLSVPVPGQSSSSIDKLNTLSSPIPEGQDESEQDGRAHWIALVISIIVLLLYLIGFLLCCLPHGLGIDTRIMKLWDTNTCGLTVRCRIRLLFTQANNGVIEGLLMLATTMFAPGFESDNIHKWACLFAFFARFLVLFCGEVLFSLTACWTMLILAVIFSISLSLSSSFTVLIALHMLIALFPVLVFCHIEKRLSPRASIQLDYTLLPWGAGRLIAAIFCIFISPMGFSQISRFILAALVLEVIVFFALSRSIIKAARLKEIMEYSSSPLPEASGEYFSLLNMDAVDSSEEDEEDIDDEKEEIRQV